MEEGCALCVSVLLCVGVLKTELIKTINMSTGLICLKKYLLKQFLIFYTQYMSCNGG